ncbi:iron complex transport system substrate-binding protein [Paenibacillus algorifonticola]|uniref:Iron complex transport system substrate-binding protein n=1 Tax=Paenibacillus algorifonticola TaxID=684063 RepID=A0A1I1Z484_9BACL|nr:ABC transporter substrate-binding protein [Paenibacillus algorifonticola]SFE25130.1 iron complex transport system substrate-binding protein [Paenibacillus algorifonticola]
MKKAVMMLVLSCMIVLAGCGSQPTNGLEATSKPEATASNEAVNATKTVKNPNGEEVVIPLKPRRIADLSGATEELLLLGIEPIASANADYGNQSELSPTIKDHMSKDTINLDWYAEPINIETVTAADPDLIILGATFNTEMYEQLSQIAPTIIIPHAYYEWRERFSFLAELFNEEEKMKQWIADYDAAATEWKEKLAPVIKDESFGMVETYPNNIVIYSTTGSAELIYKDLGFKRTEGIPDPEDWGGKEISLEGLSTINPDNMLIMENAENKMANSNVWNNITAVQKGNIYKITNVDNYNYSYTAIGRLELLNRVGQLILDNHKDS